MPMDEDRKGRLAQLESMLTSKESELNIDCLLVSHLLVAYCLLLVTSVITYLFTIITFYFLNLGLRTMPNC